MKGTLREIGFDDKETDIYLALLKAGSATVSELLQHTRIERRTIYDVLERLVQQGRASYYEENGTRTYRPVEPAIILRDLQTKASEFQEIIPKLTRLQEAPTGAKVEILKGVKGLQAVTHEIIEGRHEHLAFGDIGPFVHEEQYARVVRRFLLRLEELKLSEKIIYAKGDHVEHIPKGKYRAIDKQLIPPAPTIIYGDVVTQFIYTDPMTIIRMQSKELAETHRQYFEHFWKLAK